MKNKDLPEDARHFSAETDETRPTGPRPSTNIKQSTACSKTADG